MTDKRLDANEAIRVISLIVIWSSAVYLLLYYLFGFPYAEPPFSLTTKNMIQFLITISSLLPVEWYTFVLWILVEYKPEGNEMDSVYDESEYGEIKKLYLRPTYKIGIIVYILQVVIVLVFKTLSLLEVNLNLSLGIAIVDLIVVFILSGVYLKRIAKLGNRFPIGKRDEKIIRPRFETDRT